MPLVEFRDVSYEAGGRQILSDVSFTVEAGETLVLLGRSGSGKTTALKMTNGMLFPTRGEVRVEGKSTREWDPIRLKRRIGYVIQEVGLFPHFTVERNVGLVPTLEGWPPTDVAQRVERLLGDMGLPPEEYRTASRASFPEDNGSGWAWRARSPRTPRYCSSTSPSARSIR